MNSAEFKETITMIEYNYKPKSYPPEAKNKAWKLLHLEPVKALMAAGERLIMELPPNQMPSMQRIVDTCLAEGKKIKAADIENREVEAVKEKEEFRRGAQIAFNRSGIARDTVTLINTLLFGKIDREIFLEGIRHLDVKYPGAGFALEGGKLKNHWDDKPFNGGTIYE